MVDHRRWLIAGSVFAAVACTTGSPAASDSSSPPVATTTLPPSSAPPVTTPTPTPSPILTEGRSFGYIKSVDAGGLTLVFDLAQFFTGEAANAAARQDGVIGPGETIDNDAYIRNVNAKLRTVPISSGVKITIVHWTNCCDSIASDLTTFSHAFPGPGPTDDYQGPNSGYWLTVKNGVIVKIEEQYQP
jgi:hypothetical protein